MLKGFMCNVGMHSWQGCKCAQCGQIRTGMWPMDVEGNGTNDGNLCVYCDSKLNPDTHQKLHNWHVKHHGKPAMLSYETAEGYVTSCIWKVGGILDCAFRESENKISQERYYGVHTQDDLISCARNANAVEETADSLSIILAFKYAKNGFLISCGADDPQASIARLDLVLLERFQKEGGGAFPPALPLTKVTLQGASYYRCDNLQEHSIVTPLYHSGLYIIQKSREDDRILFVGCNLQGPIIDSVRKDLAKKIYPRESRLCVPKPRILPPQVITPRLMAAIYAATLKLIKPSSFQPLDLPEEDSDKVAVTLDRI